MATCVACNKQIPEGVAHCPYCEDKGNKADLETDLAVASPPLPCSEEAAERNDLDDQRSRDAETQLTQGHAVWRGRSAESCSGV
jgi:hypothetical protein